MSTNNSCAAQETAARAARVAQLAAVQGTAAAAAAKHPYSVATGASTGQTRKHRGNFVVTSWMGITGSALRVTNSHALRLHVVSEQAKFLT